MKEEKQRLTNSPKRREPRQERSQILVRSMLEAACRILEAEGPDALTTNRIAEVAGVGIGSLYQYFENKEAVVDALFLAEEERSLEQRVSWAAEALDLPLEQMFRLFVERIAQQHRRLHAMHVGLYREHHKHTDVRRLGNERAQRDLKGRHIVETFLEVWCERHHEEIRPTNIEYAAFLMDRVGYEMMRCTVDERPDYLADPDFVEEMLQMLVRYLRA